MKVKNIITGIALLAFGFCGGVYSQVWRLKEAQSQYETKAVKAIHNLTLPGDIYQANIYATILTNEKFKGCLSDELSMVLEKGWVKSLGNVVDYKKKYGNLDISDESKERLEFALSYKPHYISEEFHDEKNNHVPNQP